MFHSLSNHEIRICHFPFFAFNSLALFLTLPRFNCYQVRRTFVTFVMMILSWRTALITYQKCATQRWIVVEREISVVFALSLLQITFIKLMSMFIIVDCSSAHSASGCCSVQCEIVEIEISGSCKWMRSRLRSKSTYQCNGNSNSSLIAKFSFFSFQSISIYIKYIGKKSAVILRRWDNLKIHSLYDELNYTCSRNLLMIYWTCHE